MSFWSSFIAVAKSSLSVVTPIIQAEQALSPIISATVPGAAPVVAGINAGIASIEAVAPGVAAAAQMAITDGEATISAAGPAATALDTLINTLFHVHVLPQGIFLQPKVTSATIPAAPDTALS